VAGDAAIYFDAEDVSSIRLAKERLDAPASGREALIERGRTRAAELGTPSQVAERYLGLFQQAFALATAC
jgi:hypothetical protein